MVRSASFAVLRAADAALCKSGTTTLEAAVAGCPLVVAYRTSALDLRRSRAALVKIPHIGLVNIVAGREVAREFVQDALEPAARRRRARSRCSTPRSVQRRAHGARSSAPSATCSASRARPARVARDGARDGAAAHPRPGACQDDDAQGPLDRALGRAGSSALLATHVARCETVNGEPLADARRTGKRDHLHALARADAAAALAPSRRGRRHPDQRAPRRRDHRAHRRVAGLSHGARARRRAGAAGPCSG